MQKYHQQLCEAIEREVGRPIQTPSDFERLSKLIMTRVHESLSTSTLMRLWGYRKGGEPRVTTLDVLARFLGYADYQEFCNGLTSSPSPKSEGSLEIGEELESGEELKGEEGSLVEEKADVEEDVRVERSDDTRHERLRGGWWIAAVLLVTVVVAGAWWFFSADGGKTGDIPAGAEDCTYMLRNPRCEADSLDVWTFARGGRVLEEDGTLNYYMKNFDVYQVVHGLPAGEYELRVKAWHLPGELDQSLIDYQQVEDKENGAALSRAQVYAGPFMQRVKNYVSEVIVEGASYENALRFVVLEDSIRIGFRSDDNRKHFNRAVADDFRLYLLRRATTEDDCRKMAERRDSAQRAYDEYVQQREMEELKKAVDIHPKNIDIIDLWQGHELPLPEGWMTDQKEECCHLVHKTDVGRGYGDSDLYLEYCSKEPATPGLLMGQRVYLEAGTYYFGAIFFARNQQLAPANVVFAVKGHGDGVPASSNMDWHSILIQLPEDQEVTFGLWTPKGGDVFSAGICNMKIWQDAHVE